jgi:hypothetical protein
LREALKKMVKDLGTGVGIRSVLISALILRWWTRDVKTAHAQSVQDVVQCMCRLPEETWKAFKAKCKAGEGMPRALLTDTSVVGFPGYEALVQQKEEGGSALDRRWMAMVVCALEVLCQEVVMPVTKSKALEKWRVDGPSHSEERGNGGATAGQASEGTTGAEEGLEEGAQGGINARRGR